MADFEYEQTLCQVPTVHVFKIPPRTTSGGHRASDWTQEVWEGKLTVIQKGSNCNIFLIDRNTNAEFARAPVNPGAVEKCTDSSRYFVLRCVNQNTQQKAFIGLAFNERNDAFEFNVALQDFEKSLKQQVRSWPHACALPPWLVASVPRSCSLPLWFASYHLGLLPPP